MITRISGCDQRSGAFDQSQFSCLPAPPGDISQRSSHHNLKCCGSLFCFRFPRDTGAAGSERFCGDAAAAAACWPGAWCCAFDKSSVDRVNRALRSHRRGTSNYLPSAVWLMLLWGRCRGCELAIRMQKNGCALRSDLYCTCHSVTWPLRCWPATSDCTVGGHPSTAHPPVPRPRHASWHHRMVLGLAKTISPFAGLPAPAHTAWPSNKDDPPCPPFSVNPHRSH